MSIGLGADTQSWLLRQRWLEQHSGSSQSVRPSGILMVRILFNEKFNYINQLFCTWTTSSCFHKQYDPVLQTTELWNSTLTENIVIGEQLDRWQLGNTNYQRFLDALSGLKTGHLITFLCPLSLLAWTRYQPPKYLPWGDQNICIHDHSVTVFILTLTKEAICISDMLATLPTSTQCKDPRRELSLP
jgi:hypothetical protein